MNKSKIPTNLQRNKHGVYRFILSELLKNIDYEKSQILLDGEGGKKFEREILTFLRKELGGLSRRNFRLEDSKKSLGLQLTDMVVDAYGKSTNEPMDNTYSKIIQGKTEVLIQR